MFPLLIAVDLYIDDVKRALQGSFYWVRVVRPLADVLVQSLNFGRPATALAPLYTLVAIALLLQLGWLALVPTASVRLSGQRWPACR